MSNEIRQQLEQFIGTMSYYNAAESPAWGNEASARGKFKTEMRQVIESWGLTKDEFIALYDEVGHGLTTQYDFISGVKFKEPDALTEAAHAIVAAEEFIKKNGGKL